MPSSTSSSDGGVTPAPVMRGDYGRVTAADRPGVAQPVPVREVPRQRWGAIGISALVVFAVLLGAWEAYWRAFGATPGISNSNGLWAIQRRRIDHGDGGATVIVSDSRLFFDLQLPVWERLDGERPIQLGLEGTSALVFLEDLAADPAFTGRLLVGVAPQVFFGGFRFRGDALGYYRKETPSQRIGQWLSMHLIEPWFAFDDDDFALATVLERQPWPVRPGRTWRMAVRKLAVTEADRNTHMWSKVESDPDYQALMSKVWLRDLAPADDDPPPAKRRQTAAEQIRRAAKAVHTLQARGVKVLFVRAPSTGPYLAYDDQHYPRRTNWDVLLAACGAPGIYFQDYPQLQGLEQPEWSHLSHAAADQFTAALHGIIQHDFWGPEARSALQPRRASSVGAAVSLREPAPTATPPAR